jgi:WD40 repeat protein
MNLTKHWAATLDDYVIDLAWSPDGAQLAAASAAGPVSLFIAADGNRRFELNGHENGTNCLAWMPVGSPLAGASPSASKLADPPTILATGGQDGAVKFWDAAAGQHVTTTSLGTAWVEHLAWRPALKKPERPELRARSSGDFAVSGSQLSAPDSQLAPAPLLAAAAGRDLVFLNADGSTRHRFKPAPKTINALAWQPMGGCAAVAYFGGVVLWDADDFIAQKEFPYANGIHALVWSPDNRWLVSGNQDPSVHLWIPEHDIELHMSGYETKVKHLSFDHTSHWLATGGGRDACIWDCSGEGPEGREPAMLPHDAPVGAVAFQHAHGLLATASADGAVRLWSPERKQALRATVKMPVAATKLAWAPDDRLLAIGTEKGAVYVLKAD